MDEMEEEQQEIQTPKLKLCACCQKKATAILNIQMFVCERDNVEIVKMVKKKIKNARQVYAVDYAVSEGINGNRP